MANAQGQRLRIAYLVGAFPDLSETFVVRQIVGMARRGHIVDVYTTWEGVGRYVPADVERLGLRERVCRLVPETGRRTIFRTLILLLATGWRAPMILSRVLAVVWRDGLAGSLRLLHASLTLVRAGTPRYDVIHAQFGPFGRLAETLVEVGAIEGPIVTSFRGFDAGRELRAGPGRYARLFQRGALFLPVSRTLAARLIAAGCESARVRVHHSGVACSVLRYRERRLAGSRVQLVSVARLVEKKGLRYAIHAVARVVEVGRRVSYTVIGDGPERAELERLVWELGMQAHIRFVGAQSHEAVLDLIDASHLLIAPSVTAADGDEEGIPNAMKEAMAMGVPVIGTRHGGIPELVDDGVSGVLVPERDANALADRLLHLIDHSEQWPALARAARERIEAEYDIERLNEELVSLYREAAALAWRRETRTAPLRAFTDPGRS